MRHIRVTEREFLPEAELARFDALDAGGIGCFLGLVRRGNPPVAALTLEHYPGMTERALTRVAGEAMSRFTLQGCMIVHRVGRMVPGERIVLAAAAAAHRHAALAATTFLIDWLKTEAPFWKKEELTDGHTAWVAARAADEAARATWSAPVPTTDN